MEVVYQARAFLAISDLFFCGIFAIVVTLNVDYIFGVFFMMSISTVSTAVIPVAGVGTRFLPITKGIPKELLPVVDRPVIQYIVEELVSAGIQKIIFVVSSNKLAIREYFAQDVALEEFLRSKQKMTELKSIQHLHEMANFFSVNQDEPKGLGHAVLQAEALVGNEPFIVCGGDDIVDGEVSATKELIDVYTEHRASVVGVVQVPKETVSRYGIIDPVEQVSDSVFRIRDIIEKPPVASAPSTYAVGGRWLLTPEIFGLLRATVPGAGGEIQLTDALRSLVAHSELYACAYSGVYRDCGNSAEYIKAIIAFALRNPSIGPEIRSFIHSV